MLVRARLVSWYLTSIYQPITELDGRKLKNIYIDLILKIIVFLVFT